MPLIYTNLVSVTFDSGRDSDGSGGGEGNGGVLVNREMQFGIAVTVAVLSVKNPGWDILKLVKV